MLLDGLVECGLAKQQEAEANPHGQQPGHGEGQVCRAARSGGGKRGRVVLQDVSIRTNNTQSADVMNLKPHAHVCLTDYFKMYMEGIILIEVQEGEVTKKTGKNRVSKK